MELFEGRSGEANPKIPFNFLAASPCTPIRFFEGKRFLGLLRAERERSTHPRHSPMRTIWYRITTRAARGRSIASRLEIGSSLVQ
jgi:hypothetical protein